MLNPFTNEVCEIDEGIADVIQSYWDKGIETKDCCEGLLPGEKISYPYGCMAYISFPSKHPDYRSLIVRWNKTNPGIKCWEAIGLASWIRFDDNWNKF